MSVVSVVVCSVCGVCSVCSFGGVCNFYDEATLAAEMGLSEILFPAINFFANFKMLGLDVT